MKMNEIVDLRVLMLEDSDLDAELLIRELKKREIFFVSQRVQTRKEFIQGVLEFNPDIILADYKLPNFDGIHAILIAKEYCPDVPIIIVSGAVGEEEAIEILKSGATDFVLKDRLSSRLVPALHRAMREVAERDARRLAEASLHSLNAQLELRISERTSELASKNALMEEELDMARELQLSFLPASFPTLPRGASQASSAVNFASMLHPNSSVCGDYYHISYVSDTSVGVLICDVMGQGVRAAILTAILRTLEEQLVAVAGDPGAMLTLMNRSLCKIFGQSNITLFTTACYVVLDVASGRLTFANAGHPSPLVLREATNELDILNDFHPAGPALGLFFDMQYTTSEVMVNTGDMVFIFTDGLCKVENPKSEVFGNVRLREAILTHAGVPASKLIQDVFSSADQFAEGRPFSDDICIIGLEVMHLLLSKHKFIRSANETSDLARDLSAR